LSTGIEVKCLLV